MNGRRRTADARRWGRQAVLTLLAVVAAAQLGAGLLFDHGCPQVRFPTLYRRLAMLDDVPGGPAVVCLGSSRIATAVLDDELTAALRAAGDPGETFNAGMPLGDVVVAEVVLDRLLRHGARPRLALIEVSPEFLNAPPGWLPHHLERHLGWADVPAVAGEVVRAGELSHGLACRLSPLSVHRKGFWNLVGRTAERLAPRRPAVPLDYGSDRLARQQREWERIIGADRVPSPAAAAERNRAALENIVAGLHDYRPGGCAAAALDRLLARCRAEEIRPVLVAVPVTAALRGLYTDDIEAAFRSHLTAVTARHGCPFLDYRDALPDELFVDVHHPSAAGGRRFSRLLGAAVLGATWQTCRADVR